MFGVSDADLAAAVETRFRLAGANARYESAGANSSQYWEAIREAWALRWDGIAAGQRCDPYFLNWNFTPIERNAWGDIRCAGLPLYPQCPVAGVFIDFADPHLKIGLELDGKEFHERSRDTVRDLRLWSLGWRIFRITGAESYRIAPGPLDENFDEDLLEQWARTTIEGVIWSLGVVYYGARFRTGDRGRAAAISSLDQHRLVGFPLSLDGSDD